MRVIRIIALIMFCTVVAMSCKKSELYNARYEYPTFLIVQGSTSVTAGASGFTEKYSTFYLGSSVTLTWTTSSSADVEMTPTPDNQTEMTIKFKPSAAGKKITVTVKSSNGITGTTEVTVS